MTPIVSSTLLRTQSDARLLVLAGQGHERAFEAFVERYRRAIIRHCRRFLPEARAEDATQQVFLNAWSAIQSGVAVEEPRAWLYRIARNAALDAAKRAGYDYSELTEALALEEAPEGELERRWIIRETLSGVAALPENQREALLRTVVEGQSRAEIARDLRVSEGAVRQLVHRARATLRAGATAVTPMSLVTWALGLGMGSGGSDQTTRIAELALGGGATGTGVLVKSGTAVIAAGALVMGAGSGLDSPTSRATEQLLPAAPAQRVPAVAGGATTSARVTSARREGVGVSPRAQAPAQTRSAQPADARPPAGPTNPSTGARTRRPASKEDRESGSGSRGPGDDEDSGRGSDDRLDSSGPGGGDESDSDSSGPGSSGSGSSGSGSSGSGSSGSGSSGSGSKGSGSSASGSDDGDDDDHSGGGGGGGDDHSGGGGDDDSSGKGSGKDD